MGKMHCLLFALLLVGAAKSEDLDLPVFDEAFFDQLPQIGPQVSLFSLPELLYPPKQSAFNSNGGRLLTPAEGCGTSKALSTRIMGGSPAREGQYPWLALLGYRNDTDIVFKCGGSLITSRHVLTAAHCLLPYLFMVRLGEHDFEDLTHKNYEDVLIRRSTAHEHYDKSLMINDIAVLDLDHDVQFNDRIFPVCLPVNGELRTRSFVKDNPFIAGWGRISEDGPRSSVLLHAQVTVIKNDDCREKIRKTGALKKEYQFDKYVLCAGLEAGGVDACNGDSGGPLMLPIHQNGTFPFYQIGVVSYGIGCGRLSSPGVYTNVQFYANWIKFLLRKF